ncbi:MFS transporter [Streptantibioticus cattleyicolor]|uniref:Antibiotic transport protein n=1 Tax=Streptantibioticus cattleyicolor (strain ATCC 35852 / DSM 46488 / JCM 4925 / NBRC 14057 / NRRL 8057) TaxID=1003195 RepID=F8JMK5_STREN|nr:MFS transporter [Streptantibioticus cattleyicolor]AEW99311.1 antibiotic transport protein [Streptantibioticus cattleyicolor NRRL 8057 = DSM 46488]CCB71650.1 Antibiotic transport protein [Streptantibioticus cattleyicolor NRRL 8057 = DSM 46488]
MRRASSEDGGPRLGAAFRGLWGASAVSAAGDGIRQGALPLLAAALTRQPQLVAAVTVAGTVPWLVVSPVTGVLADRWERRRVLWSTDLARAVLAGAFAAVVATGGATVALLIAFNFLLASAQTLRDNALLGVVQSLVPPRLLERANSRTQATELLFVEVLGPPVGVALFALPAGLPFVVDAASFAGAAVLVLGLVRARSPVVPAPPEARVRGTVLADAADGLRWLLRHRVLRTLCLLTGVSSFAVTSVVAIAVLYAFEVLHVGRGEYAVLLAVIAVGGLAGTLLAPAASAVLGRARTLHGAMALAPAAFFVTATATGPLLAALAFTGVGASVGVTNVVGVSLRQLLVPPELMGRVNSAYRFVALGMAPLGALAGGALAERLGLRTPFLVGGALLAVGWVWGVLRLTERDVAAALARRADLAMTSGEPAEP